MLEIKANKQEAIPVKVCIDLCQKTVSFLR